MTQPRAATEKVHVLKAVRAAFEREPRINLHRFPIHMDFQHGVLTLEGDVPSDAQKEMAEFDAWYVFGVDKVINGLEVRGA